MIKRFTICLNCGCRDDIVNAQMHALAPLADKYELYWNLRIDRHPETYVSFSKLVNHSIETSPTEVVILINDRSKPTVKDVEKLIGLLENGFACVYLYNAGFFGFPKALIRRIGWWDERHLNGDFSDQEWPIRLMEADLAFYESQETVYTQDWKSPLQNNATYPNGRHWENKWEFRKNVVIRKLEDENYDYSLESIEPPMEFEWNTWDHSILNINYIRGTAPSSRIVGKKIIRK